MRKILLCGTAVFALTVGAAAAGGLGEPVMEPEVVEAATSSSSSGLIVPFLLLILIVGAASGSKGGSAGPVVSDARLKTDIAWVGMVKGNIPVYQYRYLGSATKFEGVMAQDILNIQPDAVVHWENGMMGVDYAKLGLKMKVIH
jgi:hypothetical protein